MLLTPPLDPAPPRIVLVPSDAETLELARWIEEDDARIEEERRRH